MLHSAHHLGSRVRVASISLLFPALLILLVPLAGSCSRDAEMSDTAPIHLTGQTMGTSYSVKLAASAGEFSVDGLQAEIDALLEQVNDRMSTYRKDSEISRFNRAAANTWIPVSSETAEIVLASIAISEWTGGAFDVTAGPLVNVWSFGPDDRTDREPSTSAVAAALALVGYHKLEARVGHSPALRKSSDGLYVDLSAIAKGYGVDVVAEFLFDQGIDDFLVEIGGELRAAGRKNDGQPWSIGIEIPQSDGRAAGVRLSLVDQAVATSGDYRNFFETDGQRFSHIIDPRTGRPAASGLASATVMMDNCQEADALATALMVLGPVEALRFAEDENLAVLLIARADGVFTETRSRAFANRVGSEGDD